MGISQWPDYSIVDVCTYYPVTIILTVTLVLTLTFNAMSSNMSRWHRCSNIHNWIGIRQSLTQIGIPQCTNYSIVRYWQSIIINVTFVLTPALNINVYYYVTKMLLPLLLCTEHCLQIRQSLPPRTESGLHKRHGITACSCTGLASPTQERAICREKGLTQNSTDPHALAA